MHTRVAALGLMLAAAAGAARAADPVTLDRLQVLGTRTDALRTPAAASQLTPDTRRAGASGAALSDWLAAVPGVLARPRQNFAQDEQLSVRGFGTRAAFGLRGLRLYLDGIPATMPDGQGQVSHFNPADLAEVEVLRGPFSVLYGNASGGVLQARSRSGRDVPGVSVDVLAGSDAQARLALAAGGFDEAGDWRVSASHWRTDGFREHSRARRDVLSARVARQPRDGTQLLLVANVFYAPDALDPQGLTRAQAQARPRAASAAALAFDTRKSARQAQLGAVLDQALAGGALRVAAYGGTRDVAQVLSTPVAAQRSPTSPGGVVALRAHYAGLDTRYSRGFSPNGRALQASVGVDAQWQRQQREGFENFSGATLGVRGARRLRQADTVRALDPYLQLDWQPTDALGLMAGLRRATLRFDSRDRYVAPGNPDDSGARRFAAWTPALGASLRIARGLNAYLAWGRGVETPTSNELAYRPDGAGGPNLALQPARTRSLEVGLKYAGTAWSGDVAVFDALTRGELTAATSSGGRSTFQNAGRARRRGVELAGRVALPAQLELRAALALLDARFVDGFAACSATPCTRPDTPVPAGARLPGTAARSGFIALHRGAATGWQFDVDAQYVGPVGVAQGTAEAAAGYTVFGAQAGYAWARRGSEGRVALGVANLADRRYIGSVIVNDGNQRYYEPAPGRQLNLSWQWRWGR